MARILKNYGRTTLMTHLFDLMLSGFWAFIGGFMILSLLITVPLTFILKLVTRIFRHRNIKLHGYPPAHCDADGDFKEETAPSCNGKVYLVVNKNTGMINGCATTREKAEKIAHNPFGKSNMIVQEQEVI